MPQVEILRLTVGSTRARLGGLLAGLLRFGDEACCIRCTVSLETEERVGAACARGGAAAEPFTKCLSQHCEVALDSAATEFVLAVPADAPPSFESELVSLSWALSLAIEVPPPTPQARHSVLSSVAHLGCAIQFCDVTRHNSWLRQVVMPGATEPQTLNWRLPLEVVCRLLWVGVDAMGVC